MKSLTKITTGLFLSSALFISCVKTPEACFTLDKSTVKANEKVTLTDCSKDSDGYFIEWGDGANYISGNDSAIFHHYQNPGSYTIKFDAYNKNKKGDAKTYDHTSQTITITQ